MSQWVKPLTLDLGSGSDLGAVGSSPALGSALGAESASPSAPSPAHALSQIKSANK